jgi:hypothetical protein
MAKASYKPLLFTTTMRNPERLKFMLYILEKFRGQILDDELATKIVGETIRYGLYRPMKKNTSIKNKWDSTSNGVFSEYILTDSEVDYMIKNNPQKHKEAGFAKGFPSRFATIYDITKELGFAYFTPSKPIMISELGEHLLKAIEVNVKDDIIIYELVHPEYEQQVFLQAMAKSQRKNPFVRVLNDNVPLILLLQTINLLNSDKKQNGAGISRTELPLLIFWKNNDANALYKRIVKLRKDYGYKPSAEVIIEICVNEIMNGEYKKFDPKSIMVDYPDEFIRKMRITGLISLRGAGRFIDINKNETQKVDYVIKQYANYKHFTNEFDYFQYLATLDKDLIQIKSKQVSSIDAEQLLNKWLEPQSPYTWDKIKIELSILSSGGLSRDSILKFLPAPTRLEFLTALAIKAKLPAVKVIPNYCCDDEGLPTSTAGGNKGDIECIEQQKGILMEVTMATGRQQTMMEIWPIERHLIDFQKKQESQCVFIAPTIFSDSYKQIRFVEFDSNGKNKIFPYTINEFVCFLESTDRLYIPSNNNMNIAAEPRAQYGTS